MDRHLVPGCGRVAEHPEPARGGLRHRRDEVGRQRRAEPEHARRLVGRGVPGVGPADRLADRDRRRRTTTPTTRPPATRRRCTTGSSRRSCRRSTTATPSALPRRWIASMKASMSTLAPMWSSHRMVQEYADRIWVPQSRASRARGSRTTAAEARDLAAVPRRASGRVARGPRARVGDAPDRADGSGRAGASVALGSALDAGRRDGAAVDRPRRRSGGRAWRPPRRGRRSRRRHGGSR